MKKTTLFALALAAVSGGCNSGRSKDQRAILERSLEPYVLNHEVKNPSIYLSLVETTETDSSHVYLAKALNGEDTIGLRIEIRNNIPPGIRPDGTPDEQNGFVRAGITFRSVGESSDNFVKALGDLYDRPTSERMTDAMLAPMVFSSNKTAVNLSEHRTYIFKLFLDSHTAEEAEVFCTLDTYKGLFEFRAKDAGQYGRIISAFE